MKTQILMRASLAEEEEKNIASKYFNIVEYRSDILPDTLVIPRYSALPYYKELLYDINKMGSRLINNYAQHKYITEKNTYLNNAQAIKDAVIKAREQANSIEVVDLNEGHKVFNYIFGM